MNVYARIYEALRRAYGESSHLRVGDGSACDYVCRRCELESLLRLLDGEESIPPPPPLPERGPAPFKVGDRVCFAGGGPVMVVSELVKVSEEDGWLVWCQWLDHDWHIQRGDFAPEMLKGGDP